jgi:magnesium transporter
MASRVTVRWVEGEALRSGNLDDLPQGFAGAVWIDMVTPDEVDFEAVQQRYRLHPLAVEDCLHFPQRPKIDVYEDATFLIWLIPQVADSEGVTSAELDVFLGAEHLITVHRDTVEAVDHMILLAGDYLPRGVEWTLHAILDLAVDSVFPVIETISDELEDLENLMLTDARAAQLQRLYTAKRALLQLHKVVVPERDVVRGLARLEAFVEPEAYMYFQDIGDHLARVTDSIETYRDVAGSTMDIYLSAQSNRMNQIMKQLTAVATIFMPLTLISGIYGMNFRYMPELDWRYGYFAVIGVMLVIALWMVWFFRRREWW